MGEPKAVTYKQVEKATGPGLPAKEMWEKVGKITGAGTVGLDPDGNASIDLTEASDSVRERVDKLIEGEKEEKEVEEKKRGNK